MPGLLISATSAFEMERGVNIAIQGRACHQFTKCY